MKKRYAYTFLICLINYGSFLFSSTEEKLEKMTFSSVPSTENDIELMQTILQKGGEVVIESETDTDIIFPKDYKIEWKGRGTLSIKSGGNIIFEEGATIKNTGRGSLILANYNNDILNGLKTKAADDDEVYKEVNPQKEGIIKFNSKDLHIDFSKSKGHISIFYNPVSNPNQKKSKYENPICFENNVMHGQSYFRAFMLVSNDTDFGEIFKNLNGDYALGHFGTTISSKQSSVLSSFSGILNLNGGRFVDAKDPDRNELPWLSKEELIKKLANKLLLYSYRIHSEMQYAIGILKALKYKDDPTVFNRESNRGTFYNFAGWFYLHEKQEDTILHIATKYQRTNCVKYLLEFLLTRSFTEPYKQYIRNFINRENQNGERPIDIAVKTRNKEIIGIFIEEFSKANLPYDKERLIRVIAEQKQQCEDIHSRLEKIEEPSKKLGNLYQGFTKLEKALKKDEKWSLQVNERFFGIELGSPRIKRLFKDFKTCYEKSEKLPRILIDGIPSRSRIILLREISKLKLSKYDLKQDTDRPKFWGFYDSNSADGRKSSLPEDLFPVTYFFGDLEHTVKNVPTFKQRGSVIYTQMGRYSYKDEDTDKAKEGIEERINLISTRINSKNITVLCRISRTSGSAIKPEDLTRHGYAGNYLVEDTDYLNRFNFMLDIEISRRLIDREESEFSKLPIGVAIARLLFLIENEEKSFTDLLRESSSNEGHHTFTGTAQKRKAAIASTSQSFHESFKRLKTIKNCQEVTEWQSSHLYGYIIRTPEGIHQELIDQYGGGYESSGEEYDSDTEAE